jgi:hypothetical protein
VAGPGSSSSATGEPAAPDSFEEAHAELLGDRSIQFELPPVERPDPPPQRPSSEDVQPITISVPPADAGPVAMSVFWVVVAVAAAGLLFLIVARLAGWFGRDRLKPVAPAEPEWQPEEQAARGLLGDADALAAAGRYFEAAHLLLHRSIADIQEKRPATIRKSLTSRDIAALPSIPPWPAAAFTKIVQAVERSLFGGRPLDEPTWRDCRAAYERFAFAEGWQR